jgi:hypothetical protein
MRACAKRLGGEWQIVSTPAQRTTISLPVPLQSHWWEEKSQPSEERALVCPGALVCLTRHTQKNLSFGWTVSPVYYA